MFADTSRNVDDSNCPRFLFVYNQTICINYKNLNQMKTTILKSMMTMLMALTSLSINAYDVEIEGIYYNLTTKTQEAGVTFGENKYTGNVVIPSSIISNNVTYSVTSIGYNAFYTCGELTSVIIPNSVTSIGESAFSGCNSLISVNIPESVNLIGRMAFSDCSSLTSIQISDNVNSIGPYAFNNCSSLASVSLGNGICQINQFVFYNCAFSEITLPSSITLIGARAFASCRNLSTITIPKSVTEMGLCVFENCTNLTSVEIPECINQLSGTFAGCTKLKEITLPQTLTNIVGAFSECTSLETIILPNELKEIEGPAFRHSGLTYIDIPAGITTIPQEAFSNCEKLETVIMHEGLTAIGSQAFSNCSSLQSIEIPNSVTTLEGSIFSNCSNLFTVVIGDGVTSIPQNTFAWCRSLKSVTIGRSVSIINKSFEHCNNLNEITIKDIGAWCNIYHTNISFPNPYHIYHDGEEIIDLVVPDGVQVISNYAFANCEYLKSVTLPNSVQSIGKGSFYGCKKLETFKMGNNINNIGGAAFEQCQMLTNIFCTKKEPLQTSESNFYFTNIDNGTLFVPVVSMELYENVIPWNSFKNIKSIEKFKIQYIVDNEIIKEEMLNAGDKISLPDIENRIGFSFQWGSPLEIMPAEDVTVTGTFTINDYNLTYLVDGETYKTYDVEYGAAITPEDAPEREGYTFSGWSAIPATMPAEDVTITGSFTFIDAIEDVIANDGTYQIYTLDGKLVESLQKGVNIIRYSNGTTKSVYVK